METLLLVLDLLGTFVFALSGAAAGVKHRLDLFGVLVLSYAAGNADLRVLAQPDRAVVCQDRARRYRTRCLHFRLQPTPQADALHPPVQQGSQNHQMALLRPDPTHYYRSSRYSPPSFTEIAQ